VAGPPKSDFNSAAILCDQFLEATMNHLASSKKPQPGTTAHRLAVVVPQPRPPELRVQSSVIMKCSSRSQRPPRAPVDEARQYGINPVTPHVRGTRRLDTFQVRLRGDQLEAVSMRNGGRADKSIDRFFPTVLLPCCLANQESRDHNLQNPETGRGGSLRTAWAVQRWRKTSILCAGRLAQPPQVGATGREKLIRHSHLYLHTLLAFSCQ